MLGRNEKSIFDDDSGRCGPLGAKASDFESSLYITEEDPLLTLIRKADSYVPGFIQHIEACAKYFIATHEKVKDVTS